MLINRNMKKYGFLSLYAIVCALAVASCSNDANLPQREPNVSSFFVGKDGYKLCSYYRSVEEGKSDTIKGVAHLTCYEQKAEYFYTDGHREKKESRYEVVFADSNGMLIADSLVFNSDSTRATSSVRGFDNDTLPDGRVGRLECGNFKGVSLIYPQRMVFVIETKGTVKTVYAENLLPQRFTEGTTAKRK